MRTVPSLPNDSIRQGAAPCWLRCRSFSHNIPSLIPVSALRSTSVRGSRIFSATLQVQNLEVLTTGTDHVTASQLEKRVGAAVFSVLNQSEHYIILHIKFAKRDYTKVSECR